MPRAYRESPTLFRRKPRLLLSVALAIALLLAQAGALLHAANHVDEPRDRSGIHAQVCAQCLSFSTVLATAGSTAAPIAIAVIAAGVPPVAAILASAGRPAPASYQSRAPPRPR
jgi:hypothetical protein